MRSPLHHKDNSMSVSTLWILLFIVFGSVSLPGFVSGQELRPEVQVEKKKGGGSFEYFQVRRPPGRAS